ncbi:MAG: FtsX-like permease family protein [Alphaproteobacteria bacterium]|nr:FtsX-like permease family protein [Alphaproteobacteria bacterium]
MGELALACRLALREMRGGLRGFRIFLACLALGVAAIAGVGSLSSAIVEGLRAEGRSLIGGDIELRLTHRPASAEEHAWLARRGELSAIASMRAMARALPGTARTLVELKAVDGLYPLYGEMRTVPDRPLEQLLGRHDGLAGALVEANLLTRLGLRPGERLQVGDGTFTITGVIEREPDRGTEAFALGPRLMIADEALAGTGLVQTGSLIYWTYRLRLAPGSDAQAVIAEIRRAFPEAGWRIRDVTGGTPALRQWIERITLFLTLIGLTALLVGGVGVGNAVKSYLDGRTETIATLKCLGAPSRTVFLVYLLQVMLLACIGIAIGLLAGALLPYGLGRFLAERLPVPPSFGFYPAPLLLAAGYGLLTALVFTLWPLARAQDVPAAGLFRQLVAPERRWPRPLPLMLLALSLGALLAVAILTASDVRFALGFVAGAAGSFLLLRLSAFLLVQAVRRLGRPRRPALRLALANLYRPGAATASVVLSLGLGLTLLVTIALVQGNLDRQVQEQLPEEAPAFFFIDIQSDQVAEFEQVVASVPGAGEIRRVPSLRGRIARVNGVPAEALQVGQDSRWALRGDRGLTYAALLPEGSSLVAGEWWPADYSGPPLLSLDAKIAADFGVGIGDRLTINVLGREIEATIANLRRIDWSSLGINFVVIFAPGTLEAAPHTHIATVQARGAAEEAVFRAVTDRFANVSVIRMKEALESVNKILGDIGRAARAAAAVTLVAGVLVLAGAMAAGHRRRVYDAVVLKVLGASRADVLRAYLLEYAILGLSTALVAGLLGWVAAEVVITTVMKAAWTPLPGTLVLTALLSVAATVLLGLAGTWRALSERPAPVLREF